jgi:L-alanine-DL-glutamate epimerase-like enolase superfamily enzyme
MPFTDPFSFAAPLGAKREAVDVLIVRVYSDTGLTGVGETQAWRRQGSAETLKSLVAAAEDLLFLRLVGRSPFDIAGLVAEMEMAADHSLYAQAAVGDALYVLMGKALGCPVHQLIGGRLRESIQVGVALGIAASSEAMIDQAEAAHAAGYRHLRIKIGLVARRHVENFRRLRDHCSDDVILRADANGEMSFSHALPLLKTLERFGLDIVEQPVPEWDISGLVALSAAVAIHISADESVSTDHSRIEILRRRAATIIQTKTGKNGGIHRTRALWTIARAAGIGIFPGNHPGTCVATAAVAHLAAAWPGELLVGDFLTGSSTMLANDIAQEPIVVAGGTVIVPNGAGLGVELDPAQLRRFRLDL